MTYENFIQSKIKRVQDCGFDVADLNPMLFPFQKFIVTTALKRGNYAIFADCGLGKTPMQLEWANKVSKHTNKPVLILCPLAVAGQTIQEGIKFHIEVKKYDGSNFPIQITNYEQIENIDCSIFGGVVLDESSILKNFTGVYKNLIIDKFNLTQYKLACTATPSPNDLNEIGNHSAFLNVLDAQDMRTKWFIRDEGMNNYRLKGHAKKDFYAWISSWATMITNPSDIGFDGTNFILPKLNLIEKEIVTSGRMNGKLFSDASVNATNFNAELRLTKVERFSQVAEIVNSSTEQFIIWVKQNEEGEYIKSLLRGSVEVKGSDSPSYKEDRLLGFAKNEFRVLITKSKIAQFGLNYQNCHNQILLAAGFKLHCKVTIWTDPVLEMQRTKTQRLLYKTITSDSSYTGMGMAEYITIFRKWEGNEDDWTPITNINKQNFPLDVWQKWASPVWMDIRRTDVLNGHEGTATGDEKHIAPLQLEVIHRLVNLWSNEGETVFTPFAGIGSELYQALKNNRKAIGIELKDSYFDVAVKNCNKALEGKRQTLLFDLSAA